MPKIRIPPEGPSSFKFEGASSTLNPSLPGVEGSPDRLARFLARGIPAEQAAGNTSKFEVLENHIARESLDSSNAMTRMHKIWRACPCGFRAIRARRMDLMGRRTSHFPRIEVVSIFPGDARKVCAYRKWPFVTVNFLKVLLEVNIMRQNRLFFDISECRKMAAVSMAEKSWLH